MESYEERLERLWEEFRSGKGPHPLEIFLLELDVILAETNKREGKGSRG